MKKTKRLWALLLAMVMALGLISTAFAAPTIDSGRKASLSVYKYDITAASADGAWDAASCVSTGVQDDAVTDKLAKYAIQGVEFSYLRVASISTYSQRENGQYKVGVLYGFADDAVLQAIGLTKADAYKRGNGVFYFTSDKLNKALADALADNATTVKNALEIAVRNGGAMPETDENGHSKVGGLEQGLYLVVETRVPENVTSTCNPFFVSLPMTTMDGKNWNYDVTVYPKNQTGNPTLEKTVREGKNSTGKNGGTGDITDGYAHTATASVGDVVEYQIISTLPTITSKATSLTTYTFVDTLSTLLPGTGQLICVKRGEIGYYPSDWSTPDAQENRRIADEQNRKLGVTPAQEEAMKIGSMCGWDVPGADPDHCVDIVQRRGGMELG